MPVRIYEIAKKLGIQSQQVLAKAKELGITGARVPSSSLDRITACYLDEQLRDELAAAFRRGFRGLALGNFKAFADTQHVPIRPWTLIFGANSSGKSSVLHGLLLARHAMDTGELEFPWWQRLQRPDHRARLSFDSLWAASNQANSALRAPGTRLWDRARTRPTLSRWQRGDSRFVHATSRDLLDEGTGH